MKFLIPELYACAKQGILPTYDSIDQDDTNQNRFKSFYGNTNLVHGRVIAAASSGMVEFGSLQYIVLCGLGGIVSCGATHTLITPLDLVKCRLQTNAEKYKNLINGLKVTVSEEGPKGLYRGWLPTAIGYSLQGLFKFGLYEFFKIYYAKLVGERIAYDWRTAVYLLSSASAEVFADIALCPFEAIKVKIQTDPEYPADFRKALQIALQEGGVGGLYKGLVPLWCRQIPYTMMKFASFEKTVEWLYKNVVPKPREDCTKGEQLIVTFAAGYFAGVFCAIVSHPADVLVSKMNKEKGTTAGEWIKRLGFRGLWGGLLPRIIMIGTLTALQWFIYDGFKVYTNLPRPPPPQKPKD